MLNTCLPLHIREVPNWIVISCFLLCMCAFTHWHLKCWYELRVCHFLCIAHKSTPQYHTCPCMHTHQSSYTTLCNTTYLKRANECSAPLNTVGQSDAYISSYISWSCRKGNDLLNMYVNVGVHMQLTLQLMRIPRLCVVEGRGRVCVCVCVCVVCV